jgi:hypothetical protein
MQQHPQVVLQWLDCTLRRCGSFEVMRDTQNRLQRQATWSQPFSVSTRCTRRSSRSMAAGVGLM